MFLLLRNVHTGGMCRLNQTVAYGRAESLMKL